MQGNGREVCGGELGPWLQVPFGDWVWARCTRCDKVTALPGAQGQLPTRCEGGRRSVERRGRAAEQGPGIAALETKLDGADRSGWVDDYDLLPDA